MSITMMTVAGLRPIPSLAFGGRASAMLKEALLDIGPSELRTRQLRRVDASGFVTEDVLTRMLGRLQRNHVDRNAVMVDVGCGTAGPSALLAEQTGARLIGIDRDANAIARAQRRPLSFELAHATFDCASFETTWLQSNVARAVVSIDALHLAARPATALAEINRILMDDGLLAFNVYVSDDDPHAERWVRVIEEAGFVMNDIDDQTRVWRSVMTAKHRARIEHAPYLLKCFGALVEPVLAVSRTMLGLDYGPCVIDGTRRVELIARKVKTASSQLRRARSRRNSGNDGTVLLSPDSAHATGSSPSRRSSGVNANVRRRDSELG